MTLLSRPVRAAVVAAAGLAVTAAMSSLGSGAASAAGPAMTALPGSVPATTDPQAGVFQASRMTVQVALRPGHAAALSSALRAMYTQGSPAYQHWLARGAFDRRYAPGAGPRRAVTSYLRGAGLAVQASPSPFLVRATGSSAQVSAAFGTTLRTYRDKKGVRYYQNATAVALPAGIAGYVQGVTGLTNTIRSQSEIVRASKTTRAAGPPPGCEQPYPTVAQQFAEVNDGTPIPTGYGGAPGCQGLTPAQDNSLYGAPRAGWRGQGLGVAIGLFELSGYQHADIGAWTSQFYGPRYTSPLTDVNVDGGPVTPRCPIGDTCPAEDNGYVGDIEVDADIEMQLAIAPQVRSLVVYNAPDDFTGQTELDEWTAIASDDQVASVSSSWAVCENDVTAGFVQAENTVFTQMAMQGQSTFGAQGDTGAFSCIRSDGTDIVNVLDPASQPFVTSVGGTSLENFNPGQNARPAYPTGQETVWNTNALCSDDPAAPANDTLGGFFWCGLTGAGGGGSSQWWGRPFYQRGSGVNNPFTTRANGSTHCALAAAGTPCREDPDVSANADGFTPYAEFCTGNASTLFSTCGEFSGSLDPAGWFGIGGTSLSSPLWSAIIADRDSYQGRRSGSINPLLYRLLRTAPGTYFHDITGRGQAVTTNGLFPVTPGYDEATGIGTPRMAALITGAL